MKKIMILGGVLVLILLTACGGTSGGDTAVAAPENNETAARIAQLDESYENALPVQMQLALGTLILEDGSLAVDATQAADLLLLWRALQSMSASGTAAAAEITAVLNQIQAGMTNEQIAAIADMQLTQDTLRALIQEGVITIGAGDVKRDSGNDGARGGGLPGGGGPVGGQADPARQATRQTEGSSGNNLLNQAVTGTVVQMLEVKASS